MKVLVIIGSVRETRKGLKITNWLIGKNKTEEVELIIGDLKEINLPNYNEPGSPRGNNKNYKYDKTIEWSKMVDESDAFVFVTPEYNGFFTGAMKDSIDYLYDEWAGKPYGVIGYGSRGASRAIKHLDELLQGGFKMNKVSELKINQVWNAIQGEDILEEFIDGDVEEFLNSFK